MCVHMLLCSQGRNWSVQVDAGFFCPAPQSERMLEAMSRTGPRAGLPGCPWPRECQAELCCGGDEQLSALVSGTDKCFFKRTRCEDSVFLSCLLPLVFSFPQHHSSVSREEPFLPWTPGVRPTS